MTLLTAPLHDTGDPARDALFRRLVTGEWLIPSRAAGLFGFLPKFELVLGRLQEALTSVDPAGSPGPYRQPPVMPRADIQRAQYAKSFPQLLGAVQAARPSGSAEGADPETSQGPTDLVLTPALCYGVYAGLADGSLDGPADFDVAGHCYRHEATSELGRFRSFRMREFVRVADAARALEWRDAWIPRCEAPVVEVPCDELAAGVDGRADVHQLGGAVVVPTVVIPAHELDTDRLSAQQVGHKGSGRRGVVIW